MGPVGKNCLQRSISRLIVGRLSKITQEMSQCDDSGEQIGLYGRPSNDVLIQEVISSVVSLTGILPVSLPYLFRASVER